MKRSFDPPKIENHSLRESLNVLVSQWEVVEKKPIIRQFSLIQFSLLIVPTMQENRDRHDAINAGS